MEIVGDASSYEKSLKRAAQQTQKFDRDIKQSTRGAVAGSGAFKSLGRQVAFASGSFLSAAAVTRGLRTSIDAASNLAEQQNKVNVVFGQSGRTINAWAKTTATSIGIANDQALEAVGTFGNLFRTVGLVPQKNAELSRSLVTLAADMASFNNAVPSDVLLALRSGLIGEAEPLRRFGVLLSETRVQQEAMRETGKRTSKALTDQEKVLARYNLILQDTAPAQGDFARTSDGLANSQRTLSAEVRDLSAALGKGLKPAVEAVVKTLADGIGAQDKHSDRTRKISLQSRLLGVSLRLSGDVLKQWRKDLEHDVGPVLTLSEAINKLTQSAGKLKPITVFDREQPGRSPLGAAPFQPIAGAPRRPKASLAFQMSMLQEQLAKAELTASQRDDRAKLVLIQNLLHRQITASKDLKLRTQLYGDLKSVQDQIAAIDDKAAADRADAQEKEKAAKQKVLDAAKKAAQAAKEHAAKLKALEKQRQQLEKQRQQQALTRLTAAQFRQLGFGPSGADVIPGGKELIKRLGKVKDQVKGTVLDTKENRKLLERIRHTLVDGLGKLAPEVRSKIDELLDALDIEDAAKKRGKKPFDFGRRDFGHGFGGLPEFMRSGLTRLGTPAGMPIPKSLTAAQLPANLRPTVINIENFHSSAPNVAKLENELVKRSRARPHPRRGP